jgi:hypothetical protein
MFADIGGDSRVQHTRYVPAFSQLVSYFCAAYINEGRLDNVSPQFFDAFRSPDVLISAKVRHLTAGPVHSAYVTLINQLNDSGPVWQIIDAIGADQPVN